MPIRPLLFLLALVALPAPASEAPPPQDAAALVERIFDQAAEAVLRERARVQGDPQQAYRLIDQLIAPHVDFDLMARLALGGHWASASPEQRRRFTAAFRDSLMQTYAAVLANHIDELTRRLQGGKPLLRVLPPRAQPGATRLLVRTELQLPEGPLAVDYRFHANDGRWRVYDLIIMNISFLTNLRVEYAGLLQGQGLDQLISRMESHNQARHPD